MSISSLHGNTGSIDGEHNTVTPGTHILRLPLQHVCAANLLRLAHCCSHMQRLLQAALSVYIVIL